MKQFYSVLKLGLEIVTGTQAVTSKWSPGSTLDENSKISVRGNLDLFVEISISGLLTTWLCRMDWL